MPRTTPGGAAGARVVDGVMNLRQLGFYTYPLRTTLVYDFALTRRSAGLQIERLEEMWSFGDMIANAPARGAGSTTSAFRPAAGVLLHGVLLAARARCSGRGTSERAARAGEVASARLTRRRRAGSRRARCPSGCRPGSQLRMAPPSTTPLKWSGKHPKPSGKPVHDPRLKSHGPASKRRLPSAPRGAGRGHDHLGIHLVAVARGGGRLVGGAAAPHVGVHGAPGVLAGL